MKEFKAKLKILKVEKLNNSIYGNPCRRLITETEDGKILIGKTATNAILGYEVSWTWEGDWKVLAYHYEIPKEMDFEKFCNEYYFYNCNAETGKRITFYKEA